MPHVLVAGKIHQAGIEVLRRAPGISFELVEEVSVESYRARIEKADALLIRTQPLTQQEIRLAKKLRIVSRHGVGFDSVDLDALSQRHIPLTIVGDVNSLSVAEHTLALILATAKNIRSYDGEVRRGNWECRNSFAAQEISGKQLFIIGFGRIGREVARLAQAFNMRISAYDPHLPYDIFMENGVDQAGSIHQALPTADIVTVHSPFTRGRALIGQEELALMKPSALLINTSRGGLVDETALTAALMNNQLAGAALDVFSAEPPETTTPLLSIPRNVIVTPHSAGLTQEAAMRMSVSAAENIVNYFNGTLNPQLVVNQQVLNTCFNA